MPPKVSVLLLLLVSGSLQAQSLRNSQEIINLYDEAVAAKLNDPSKSIRLLDSIEVLGPSHEYVLKTYLLHAEILIAEKELSAAKTYFQKAEELIHSKKLNAYVGELLFIKGSLYKEYHHDSAYFYFDVALHQFRLLNDSLHMAQCLIRLSNLQMEKGNYLTAMGYLTQVDELIPKRNLRQRINLFINQSHMFTSVGLDTRAVGVCKKSMLLIEQLPNSERDAGLLPAFGNICDGYLNLNQPDSALLYVHKAIQILDSIPAQSPFWITMATIQTQLGKPSIALTYLDQYRVTPEFKFNYLLKLAGYLDAYQQLGDVVRANKIASQIIAFNPVVPSKLGMLKVYSTMESAFKQLGNQPMAHSYLEKHFAIYREIFNQKQVAALLDKDFEVTLQQSRKQAELEANFLKASIAFQQQQKWGLIIGSVLLLIIISLLWIRYRYLKRFNKLLNKMVDERTHELSMKNEQLSEYAFINAHKLRAPLARILGLQQIYRMKDSELSTEALMDLLAQESQGLDAIVHSITEAIEEKRIFNRHDL